MKDTKTIQLELAAVLRNVGSKKCQEKAEELERTRSLLMSLHLRDLELESHVVISIASLLNDASTKEADQIASLSFSYNALMGDEGAIAIAKNLPRSIREIGLVNCGIGDLGGTEILAEIRKLPSFRMICVEGNNFSEKLKVKWREFSRNNPHIVVVY